MRYIGCSNFAGWQLMKALGVSVQNNLEKFVSLQAQYSLLIRDLEYELVPLCLDQGLGILIWSPLAGGALSGKYRRGKLKPEGGRLSNNAPEFDEEKTYNIVEELDKIAKNQNATVSEVALNYLLHKPGVTSVIMGVKSQDQMVDNLKTIDWEMLPEEFAHLDNISKPTPIYPYDFLSQGFHD